jgi:glycosyltransferase involved in cell wall biosynthesis
MSAPVPLPVRTPPVDVVIATRDRPELLRAAIRSVLDQDYDGDIRVFVVFDQHPEDPSLTAGDAHRSVTVVSNARTPGLAGARNTGILALDSDLVAFCDDDDRWAPQKLSRQTRALGDGEFATCAIEVEFRDRCTPRLAGCDLVTVEQLARSRMAMLHSSSFLIRRAALVDSGQLGLVAEDAPGSQNEDWDLLLRAAKRAPIVHVDEPLVRITWGASSYFADQWETKNLAHRWLLDRHPEIGSDPVGAGLMYGKLAFGHAALGERRQAVRMAGRSLRARWSEPRAFIAIAVAIGLLSPAWVLQRLNERGHGI